MGPFHPIEVMRNGDIMKFWRKGCCIGLNSMNTDIIREDSYMSSVMNTLNVHGKPGVGQSV